MTPALLTSRLTHDGRFAARRAARSYFATAATLTRAIEAKDPGTSDHTERVADIALRIAEELGFAGDELDAIFVGALIHDIGKITVPDRILLKPGPLEPEELAHIRRHPEASTVLLEGLDLPEVVEQMARSHHERYAGGGYPDGLAGEGIPLPARILCVADALDAMTSDRPYRPARSFAEALAEIDAGCGEQFCPRVVAALHACLGHVPAERPYAACG